MFRRLLSNPARLVAIPAVAALGIAACGDGDSTTAPTTTAADATTTSSSSTTTEPRPEASWSSCESPEGFTIDHPSDWHTNDGSTVAACTLFDPEPFEVPEATDVRVAAISAYVDDVRFADATASIDADADRAVATIDGHQAVRVHGPAGELYPDDVEAVRYFIDLDTGVSGPDDTLVVDTVSIDDTRFEDHVAMLDRMVRTIDIAHDAEAEGSTAIRYQGGGMPFDVDVAVDGTDVCLTVEPADTETCFAPAAPTTFQSAALASGDLSVFGGVAGARVQRVEVDVDGETHAYVPSETVADGTRAWAVPADVEAVDEVRWYAASGDELGARDVADSSPEPVGAFDTATATSEFFPSSGSPSYLADVRVGAHDGFDRVVFDFPERGAVLSYEVGIVDEVVAVSGQTVAVEGDHVIEVTMTPASGVDLSGEKVEKIYEGAERIDLSRTGAITEVVAVEDFENVLRWAIGVDGDAAFAVEAFQEPLRLVIDVEA